MTIRTDTIRVSGTGALAALRALAVDPSQPTADQLQAVDRQAQLLRDLLPEAIDQLPSSLTDLMPSILVEHIDDIPVAGIAFWGNDHWHIHIRAGDPANAQAFTMLHELKHIIDHPLRRRPNALRASDWEAIADRFAVQVLVREPGSGCSTRKNNETRTKEHPGRR